MVAVVIFIFLGWFLLSVKKSKSSNLFMPNTGWVFEKFKNLPSLSVELTLVFVLYDSIKDIAPG